MLASTTRYDTEIGNTGTPTEPDTLREDPTRADAGYRIGAASRLTGITADTLRVWERRYRVVTPGRSPKGGRRYSREDVSRLALIKQLVDVGHAIGSVAGLNTEALQERLDTTRPGAVAPGSVQGTDGGCTVAVLGEALPARLRARNERVQGLELLTLTRDPEAFASTVAQHHPDVIVLEYPTLKGRVVKEVNRLLQVSRARRALVVYAFAKRDTARRLRSSRIVPLRAPVELHDLQAWCLNRPMSDPPATDPAANEPLQPAPARRYDAEALSRIASISTTVKCECPHHLAELVFALRAFEDYSTECENSSDADAALHAYLHNATGHARAILESALARIITAEGIEL